MKLKELLAELQELPIEALDFEVIARADGVIGRPIFDDFATQIEDYNYLYPQYAREHPQEADTKEVVIYID